MNQCSRLQGVARILAAHELARDPSHLVVNIGKEIFGRRRIGAVGLGAAFDTIRNDLSRSGVRFNFERHQIFVVARWSRVRHGLTNRPNGIRLRHFLKNGASIDEVSGAHENTPTGPLKIAPESIVVPYALKKKGMA